MLINKVSNQNEDRFWVILENNPHPMWIYDHETLQFQEVNPSAIQKYGYTRSEFLKMKITDIRPKDQVARLLAEHKTFEMGLNHVGEWQHLSKNGKLIDVEITAYAIYFGGRPAILVQAQDITERKQAQETLRQLAVLEERNRIAREIHDTLAQAFTGIIVQLEAAQDLLGSKSKANSHIVHARKLARKSLSETRRSVTEIRPPQLERAGLTAAIRRLVHEAKRDGVSIQFVVKGKPRLLPHEIENNLLRICQEALTNIVRHAEANRTQIEFVFRPRTVRLVVQDNGKGFSPNRTGRTGLGLIGMRERANQIGAKLTLNSKLGNGTKVALDIKL